MLSKAIFFTTTCLILVWLPFNKSMAQQQTKSFKGNLLLNQQHPETDVRETLISNHRTHRSPFRTINGTNNNISSFRKRDWGAAGIPYFRALPAAYGAGDPNNEMSGMDRPSPREISNVLIDEPVTQFTTRNLSALLYQWGQFIDHDFGLTPTGNTEYAPITLPEDEMIFTEEIPFFRSEFRLGRRSVRQQINLNTSYIDGSMVYGSNSERALWVRTQSNGKMKTSAGDLLPYNTIDAEYTGAIDPNAPIMDGDGGGTIKTFVAGDVRAAENPILTSFHILFVREHNSICDRLVRRGLTNDEQIYQIARKVVGALIQAITYQEFLPALGISLRPYNRYNPRVRPDLANTFAAAGYRIGHTMVSDDVVVVDNDCEEVPPGEFDLVETFFNPQLVADYGIEVFLKGATVHDLYETDTKINDVLRNFLFGDESSPVRFGIDLGSINIQRGRDHGLPDYNTVRKFYTRRAATKFSDISSNDTVATKLEALYGNINNIDLWIGILSEDHLPNKSMGKTMFRMLKKQFKNLRDGDFYFYLNDPFLPRRRRNEIKNTTLADVIKRNTNITKSFRCLSHR